MTTPNFAMVTELPREPISALQLERLIQRYFWAANQCAGCDVLEVACGPGVGISLLGNVARSVMGTDIDGTILAQAAKHYGPRFAFFQSDAQKLPLPDNSFDVILLFEAIYYLADPECFVDECLRVLRPGGRILISSVNKDLYDFNPSAFKTKYLNPPELTALLKPRGFSTEFFGGDPVKHVVTPMRWIKFAAARCGVIPKSMRAKRLLKRLVFGKLSPMPSELTGREITYVAPVSIPGGASDKTHQIIYCTATRIHQSARYDDVPSANQIRVLFLVSGINPHIAMFLEQVLDRAAAKYVITVGCVPVAKRSSWRWLYRQIRFWGMRSSIGQALGMINQVLPLLLGKLSVLANVKDVCLKYKVEWRRVSNPNSLDFVEWIRLRKIDVLVSLQPWILEPRVLEAMARAALNVHTGILPGYRGVRPIFRMMDDNLAELGVTVHTMTAQIDAGNIVELERWPNRPGSTLAENNRLAYLAAAEAVVRALRKVKDGSLDDLPSIPQDSRYFRHPTARETRRARRKGMRFS
jgi:SAM-dependent methyltransferase/folate-dependent phosphoribosylglycinamide formyltransferase PurN